MAWLLTHMWLWLLLAALFGILIGWALRGLFGRGKYEALESELSSTKADVSELRAKLAAKGTVAASASAEPAQSGDTSLEWRNRYLESRVRYLEGKLSEPAAAAAPVMAQAVATPAPSGTGEDDLERLNWRNRYLDGRVKYLEGLLAGGGALTTAAVATKAVASKPAAKKATAKPAVKKPAAKKPAAKKATAKPAALKVSPVAKMSAADLETAVLAAGAGTQPKGIARPAGKLDDLKEIAGVGPKNEKWLHENGIYQFAQIAALTVPGVAWLAGSLPTFGTRVYRENWVDQAAKLAKGEMTEGKAKYLKGDHV